MALALKVLANRKAWLELVGTGGKGCAWLVGVEWRSNKLLVAGYATMLHYAQFAFMSTYEEGFDLKSFLQNVFVTTMFRTFGDAKSSTSFFYFDRLDSLNASSTFRDIRNLIRRHESVKSLGDIDSMFRLAKVLAGRVSAPTT